MAECDTLLIVGSNDPWTEFYPPPGTARAVQIDIDGRVVGNRYPIEVGLVGDAAATLSALLAAAARGRPRRRWRGAGRAQRPGVARAGRGAGAHAGRPGQPRARRVGAERRLPADAQVAIDVGSCVYWYARQLRLPARRPGAPVRDAGQHGLLAFPYGIAAKLAASRPAAASR